MEAVHIHTDNPKSNLELLIFVLPVIAFVVVLILLFQLFFAGTDSGVRGVSTEAVSIDFNKY